MRLKGTDSSRLEVAANVATDRPLLEQQTSEPGTRAGCFIHYVERVLTWFNKSQRFMPEMAVVKDQSRQRSSRRSWMDQCRWQPQDGTGWLATLGATLHLSTSEQSDALKRKLHKSGAQ